MEAYQVSDVLELHSLPNDEVLHSYSSEQHIGLLHRIQEISATLLKDKLHLKEEHSKATKERDDIKQKAGVVVQTCRDLKTKVASYEQVVKENEQVISNLHRDIDVTKQEYSQLISQSEDLASKQQEVIHSLTSENSELKKLLEEAISDNPSPARLSIEKMTPDSTELDNKVKAKYTSRLEKQLSEKFEVIQSYEQREEFYTKEIKDLKLQLEKVQMTSKISGINTMKFCFLEFISLMKFVF